MSKGIIGLLAGALALAFTLIAPSPWAGLDEMAWRAMGLAALMSIWWITEAVPIPVTALVPLVVGPLSGISSMQEVSGSYAHPLIFLFLGGFMISLAMERSGLHQRVARYVMLAVGSRPKYQVGGMMLVTAFLSMWMSNTATTVMMLPITLSIIALLKGKGEVGRLPQVMLLGVAYGASIGGVATLIGTPPNTLLAAYLSDSYGVELGFGQWMLFGVPFSAIMLVLTWLWLTKSGLPERSDPSVKDLFRQQLAAMGPLTSAERKVMVVFSLAAFCWMGRGLLIGLTGLPISDTGVAISAAILLFILPFGGGSKERLLEWEQTSKVPWGILVLFGGGLSLAGIIQRAGLAEFIGELFASAGGFNLLWVILIVAFAVVFLTEITSNTATTAGLLPLLGPIAMAMGAIPLDLAIPAALAASCAFMLPVATPPNAIVFGSGELEMKHMMRAGLALNFISTALIVVFAKFVIPLVFY